MEAIKVACTGLVEALDNLAVQLHGHAFIHGLLSRNLLLLQQQLRFALGRGVGPRGKWRATGLRDGKRCEPDGCGQKRTVLGDYVMIQAGILISLEFGVQLGGASSIGHDNANAFREA